MSRYQPESEAPAGPDLLRILVRDTEGDASGEGVPVELLGLKRHVWLRPGAREAFAVLKLSGPAALPILAMSQHDGFPVVVRPRVLRSMRGVRLAPAEAIAMLRWLAPTLAGSPFRGRLTPDDIWLDLQGHPRLMGLVRPESVGLHPPFAEPPEVAAGEVHAYSDLYSLGAILYQAVSGLEPGHPAADLAHQAAVPADVARQIMRAMSEAPEARVDPDAAAYQAGTLSSEPQPPEPQPPVIALRPAPVDALTTATRAPLPRERWDAAVVVDTLRLAPAARMRLAVLAGVSLSAVERARQRELPFVVGAYADRGEAERVAGRFRRRNIAAELVDTRTPPIVQWAGVAFLAALLGIASSGYVRYAFGAAAAALLAVGVSRVRQGLTAARIGLAIVDRLQAGPADNAAGDAATVRARLLRSALLGPLRCGLMEAMDEAVDDLADIAAADEVNPAGLDAPARRAAEARVAAATAEARRALGALERA
ncbi:MAG: hypothetical protein EXR69_05745 [Myxococcales bacterium]|nr:hypothetical protein [Myxococcales bacterium]